eukprot:NODE_4080_length_844_cov_49.585774_g3922_i0.p1 GENE.NODE_4080_length_844_cov_49.585774_g3922_i0~~NODE_4080_length_844_cov_49.585774_g3922_i0.p1  ORF type:complete len:224 (+),score=63.36 NODE_4080_length_844_cov_49.585774_g3922_i0:72-743(+)
MPSKAPKTKAPQSKDGAAALAIKAKPKKPVNPMHAFRRIKAFKQAAHQQRLLQLPPNDSIVLIKDVPPLFDVKKLLAAVPGCKGVGWMKMPMMKVETRIGFLNFATPEEAIAAAAPGTVKVGDTSFPLIANRVDGEDGCIACLKRGHGLHCCPERKQRMVQVQGKPQGTLSEVEAQVGPVAEVLTADGAIQFILFADRESCLAALKKGTAKWDKKLCKLRPMP